jgi:D-alanine-D-alanine ligase
MSRHVAVLMGGWSAEREVSLVTGRACAEALRAEGFRATEIDVGRDLARVLDRLRPDVCFNALHGRWGEDGCVQGLLEVMAIPYTHSGVRASALAMHKPAAKEIFREAGIPLADGKVVSRNAFLAGDVLPPPYVVKPLNEGSSVGVHIVMPGENARPFTADDWPFGDEVLVERYVPGREIQVAVMGDRAIGAIEIRPKGRFYDYEAKYTDGKAVHLMPAPLPPEDYQEALRLALLAHASLGCRGVSRADLRYDDTGPGRPQFSMLEINTQPGMTPLSLVPEIAAHAGVSFRALVRWMVEDAGCGR